MGELLLRGAPNTWHMKRSDDDRLQLSLKPHSKSHEVN
jgi:hypothetical protein